MSNSIQAGLDASAEGQNLGFVDFTTGLVGNVYKIIVDSSMEQLKAYGAFVADVSKPLAKYQEQVTGIDFSDSNMLAGNNGDQLDNYIQEVLGLTLTNNSIVLSETQRDSTQSHFQGIAVSDGTTDKSFEESLSGNDQDTISREELQKFVYEKLAQSTSESYNMLLTVLKLGMQKVEVTDGTIHTKLVFHVDASEAQSSHKYAVESRATSWGVQGSASAKWGWGKASVSGGIQSSNVRVNVVNEKSSAAVNMSTDIIGSVTLKFRSTSFPSYEANQS
jgi:hypothetical protein